MEKSYYEAIQELNLEEDDVFSDGSSLWRYEKNHIIGVGSLPVGGSRISFDALKSVEAPDNIWVMKEI